MPRRDTRSGKTCHAIYPARDHRPLLEKDKKEAIVRFRRERITISPAPNSGNFLPRPKTENPAIGAQRYSCGAALPARILAMAIRLVAAIGARARTAIDR
jgi:hypothetical protein